MIHNNRELGSKLEDAACRYLTKNGYNIIERNFRVGRLGEVDIIAAEDEYVCFIEVKGRSSDIFGTPAEAVNYHKRSTIIKLASIYSGMSRNSDMNIRFDIAEIYFTRSMNDCHIDRINLIRDAF